MVWFRDAVQCRELGLGGVRLLVVGHRSRVRRRLVGRAAPTRVRLAESALRRRADTATSAGPPPHTVGGVA